MSAASVATQPRVPGKYQDGGQWTSVAGGWAASLPKDQQEALTRYASTEYLSINRDLRSGTTSATTDVMDAAFETAPALDREVTVYRGMTVRGFVPEVGATFTDMGFVSTSGKASIARAFGSGHGESVFAIIRLPVGTKPIPMPYVLKAWHGADFPDVETEILLNRGSRFKVTGLLLDGRGRKTLMLDLLP